MASKIPYQSGAKPPQDHVGSGETVVPSQQAPTEKLLKRMKG